VDYVLDADETTLTLTRGIGPAAAAAAAAAASQHNKHQLHSAPRLVDLLSCPSLAAWLRHGAV